MLLNHASRNHRKRPVIYLRRLRPSLIKVLFPDSLLDVIAEQRRYIDIETGYTEALKQTYDAVVDIERAVGTLEH